MSVVQQLLFPVEPPGISAVDFFDSAERHERGAIYTREEVVEFILDLVGYVPAKNLSRNRLLEPSCGAGGFLIPAVKRLLTSFRGRPIPPSEIEQSIRAVDVNGAELNVAKKAVEKLLLGHGLSGKAAVKISNIWLRHGDFLVSDWPDSFTHIVGNPPYVRQESIPEELLRIYRARFSTLFDRADLYIPFFEKSLGLLERNGLLGFICSDRWMKNRYGGPLRGLIARDFHLKAYVDFTNCPAFHSEVVAYPAVTVLSRSKPDLTRTAHRPKISREVLGPLSRALRGEIVDPSVIESEGVVKGEEPWLLNNIERLNVIREIEGNLPKIEDAGCRVVIGVATGADRIYVRLNTEFDVEESRKLPLVMTRDIESGEVNWKGMAVLNPFGDDGKVVNPGDYPRFAAYLEEHRLGILGRNVSRRNPRAWFRTIDRIYPELCAIPKLLIPDIKGSANIVFEEGMLYPHHNLYFVTSNTWDLRALQAVLLSRVAHAFIATYSVRMRGDFLRFQAQYLRRIRVPDWATVPRELRKELRQAAIARDIERCNVATREAFGLNQKKWEALAGN